MRVVKAQLSIVSLQLKFDKIQNDSLIQSLVFLAGVEVKKNELQLENIELTHLF